MKKVDINKFIVDITGIENFHDKHLIEGRSLIILLEQFQDEIMNHQKYTIVYGTDKGTFFHSETNLPDLTQYINTIDNLKWITSFDN